jgi:hypothetical protein
MLWKSKAPSVDPRRYRTADPTATTTIATTASANATANIIIAVSQVISAASVPSVLCRTRIAAHCATNQMDVRAAIPVK